MVFPAPAKARLLDHTAAAALDAELDDALVLLLVDSLLLVHPVHHLRSGLQVLSRASFEALSNLSTCASLTTSSIALSIIT